MEPRRNAFGQDFELQGLRWTKDLCEADSDGDGFTNGEELGDPCCVWHEGAIMPLWMTEDEWEVTHPGFPSSSPSGPINKTEVCKDIVRLESASYFNEGEEMITVEYIINEHEIDSRDTIYNDVLFNFWDNATYDVVGIEPIVDNAEMLHHFVMFTCSNLTENPGVVLEDEEMLEMCEEAVYIWAPGTGNFSLPPHVGLRVGKGTNKRGFQLNVHYDNPLLLAGERDASGVRLHMTPTLREEEVGVLWTGSIVGVGLIPPGETDVFSASICQMQIDEEQAPGGVNVFAYLPHMHYLGRRMWSDHLVDPLFRNGSSGYITDLEELQKIEELSRDDAWSFDLQKYGRMTARKLRDGDYIATTCVFDSTDRDGYTTGGISSFDEMCINYFYYYPATATDPNLYCSGPRYFGLSLPSTATSVTDVATAANGGTEIPLWRKAYLSGEMKCEGGSFTTANLVPTQSNAEAWGLIYQKCGETAVNALTIQSDGLASLWHCTEECAKLLYNSFGCALMEDAAREEGRTYSLFATPLEGLVEANCRLKFLKLYEEAKGSS